MQLQIEVCIVLRIVTASLSSLSKFLLLSLAVALILHCASSSDSVERQARPVIRPSEVRGWRSSGSSPQLWAAFDRRNGEDRLEGDSDRRRWIRAGGRVVDRRYSGRIGAIVEAPRSDR